MSKIIKVKQSDDGECYFDIHEVLTGTNVSPEDVEYYELDIIEGTEQLRLTLYDKDRNQLKVSDV